MKPKRWLVGIGVLCLGLGFFCPPAWLLAIDIGIVYKLIGG